MAGKPQRRGGRLFCQHIIQWTLSALVHPPPSHTHAFFLFFFCFGVFPGCCPGCCEAPGFRIQVEDRCWSCPSRRRGGFQWCVEGRKRQGRKVGTVPLFKWMDGWMEQKESTILFFSRFTRRWFAASSYRAGNSRDIRPRNQPNWAHWCGRSHALEGFFYWFHLVVLQPR